MGRKKGFIDMHKYFSTNLTIGQVSMLHGIFHYGSGVLRLLQAMKIPSSGGLPKNRS